jgi:hypothetical protein
LVENEFDGERVYTAGARPEGRRRAPCSSIVRDAAARLLRMRGSYLQLREVFFGRNEVRTMLLRQHL